MKQIKFFGLFLLLVLFFGCNRTKQDTKEIIKEPTTVRELMESEGWIFCMLISSDCYYPNEEEPRIAEDAIQHDLFKRENGGFVQFCVTTDDTDNRLLSFHNPKTEPEYFQARTWINSYLQEGSYIAKGRLVKGYKKGEKVTRHYNARTINSESRGYEYFNLPEHGNIIHSDSEKENIGSFHDTRVQESTTINKHSYEPEYETRDVWVDCYHCYGSGDCSACNGKGWDFVTNARGEILTSQKCPVCLGNRKCIVCYGQKGHYEKQVFQVK